MRDFAIWETVQQYKIGTNDIDERRDMLTGCRADLKLGPGAGSVTKC